MINGFEEITYNLTQYEKTLVKPMVLGLKSKIGSDSAIKNKEMVKALKEKGYKINEARLRKLINYIRVHKLIKNLISTNKGYYIAETDKEVKDYIESLTQRINEITRVRNSFL